MLFNKENYLAEMRHMVDNALERLKVEKPRKILKYKKEHWNPDLFLSVNMGE